MKTTMMNIQELNQNELAKIEGGFFFLAGVVSYAINTTLVAGTVAGVSAAAYSGFQTGYATMKEMLS